ncbi:MAG: 16S rRNA (cytidine(1402)-2'-O)-methyltransferase [Eubacteriales bacterium]|nr:16S rRNA (cytidine(1402)-2'-O)-methyltransferase [Eubacteriales bacterium]
MLYLCATPIGNLEDITIRVLNTLKNVELILAEDTRHSAVLLNHFDIKKPMMSFHKFSDQSRLDDVIDKLKNGAEIALISDAGTPCISDPGYELVKACVENNIEFTSLPGATAFTTALTLSGLSTQSFLFYGFLPQKKSAIEEGLSSLKAVKSTLIFYEAPHRVTKTLSVIKEHLGDRNIALCRELTKLHETVLRSTISDAIAYYEENSPKGEFVIVVEGGRELVEEDVDYAKEYNKYIESGIDRKEALLMLSKRTGVPKREIYNLLNKD